MSLVCYLQASSTGPQAPTGPTSGPRTGLCRWVTVGCGWRQRAVQTSGSCCFRWRSLLAHDLVPIARRVFVLPLVVAAVFTPAVVQGVGVGGRCNWSEAAEDGSQAASRGACRRVPVGVAPGVLATTWSPQCFIVHADFYGPPLPPLRCVNSVPLVPLARDQRGRWCRWQLWWGGGPRRRRWQHQPQRAVQPLRGHSQEALGGGVGHASGP